MICHYQSASFQRLDPSIHNRSMNYQIFFWKVKLKVNENVANNFLNKKLKKFNDPKKLKFDKAWSWW